MTFLISCTLNRLIKDPLLERESEWEWGFTGWVGIGALATIGVGAIDSDLLKGESVVVCRLRRSPFPIVRHVPDQVGLMGLKTTPQLAQYEQHNTMPCYNNTMDSRLATCLLCLFPTDLPLLTVPPLQTCSGNTRQYSVGIIEMKALPLNTTSHNHYCLWHSSDAEPTASAQPQSRAEERRG